MTAFILIMSGVSIYMLGKLVGREESMYHTMKYLAHLRSELSIEDKLLFDKWFVEYKERNYPNPGGDRGSASGR